MYSNSLIAGNVPITLLFKGLSRLPLHTIIDPASKTLVLEPDATRTSLVLSVVICKRSCFILMMWVWEGPDSDEIL